MSTTNIDQRLLDHSEVPGTVISHSPASSQAFIGSPTLIVLANGNYVAAHDFFGPRTEDNEMAVFGSDDRGENWKQLSRFKGQWWSTLFLHKDALYLIGTSSEYGDVVIRRSEDGGNTWTDPKDEDTGLIRNDAHYHCAPVPLLIHNGRIWRAYELAEGERSQWSVLVFSIALDADLLKADNWRISKPFKYDWPGSKWIEWIEGNIILTPEGKLVDILRANGEGGDKAAIVHIANDGLDLSHDRDKDIIYFPGGSSKFTIRYDVKTSRYWSIGSKQTNPKAYRNILVLTSSWDLWNWNVEGILLQHPDEVYHAWQYVDWLFEGDDIIAASRTAYDDGLGGASTAHDANYLTFHRINNFRTF